MLIIRIFDFMVDNPKKILRPLIIALLFIIVGSALYTFFHKTDFTIKFTDDVKIAYGSDIQSIELIESIGGDKIRDSWLDKKENRIIIGGWIVTGDELDTSKLGVKTITFTTNDVENNKFNLTVSVQDMTKPTVNISKTEFEYDTEEIKDLDLKGTLMKYITVSDNYDKEEDIKVKISKDTSDLKIGENTVVITATDTAGNKTKKNVSVTLKEKEKPIKKEETKEESKDSDDKQADNTQENVTDDTQSAQNSTQIIIQQPQTNYAEQPQVVVPSVPACTYQSFYASSYGGSLISAYDAAQSYFNSCSGSASVLPINDDEGNTIGFSVG